MAAPRQATDKIGTGLALPFRWLGGAGYATVSGVSAVLQQLELVLGETCAAAGTPGSLVYNQALGTLIQRLRHKGTTDPATEEMAVYYVLEKCKKLVPQARIRKLKFTPNPAQRLLVLEAFCDILDREHGSVLQTGQRAAVTI